MSEATTISAMFKSIAHGPAWHGPSVSEALEDLTAVQAARRPLAHAHSIWEILLHMNAWQDYTLSVLEGGSAAFLEAEANWPPAPDDNVEAAWEAAKRHFEGGGEEIREIIVHFDDAKMHETVPGRDFPVKVLLHGVVQHNLYHLGQIALLKKAFV